MDCGLHLQHISYLMPPKIESVEPVEHLTHSYRTYCIVDPWLHLLVPLDSNIANSDYQVNGCRES